MEKSTVHASICRYHAPRVKTPTFCVSAPPHTKSWIRPWISIGYEANIVQKMQLDVE